MCKHQPWFDTCFSVLKDAPSKFAIESFLQIELTPEREIKLWTWVTKLNQFNSNFANAEMVKAFISSTEYRQRFGPWEAGNPPAL